MKEDPSILLSQKTEYSPNNSTSQNIEIYKSRMAAQNYSNNYNMPQYNINLFFTDHFNNINNQYNYNNMPFNGMPYYMQNPENMSPSQIDSKNNTMNNTMNNNIINDTNESNIINNKNNTKENKEDEVEDPDEINFRNPNDKDKEDSKDNEDDKLSSISEEKNSYNEQEFKDKLLAQYTKIKRIKNKWKVQLKGCIVQQDNKETICGRVNGELEREW